MVWTPTYEYEVIQVIRIKDGDSFWLKIQRGFREEKLIDVRLLDIDTWEIRGAKEPFRSKGVAAKKFVETWFNQLMNSGYTVWIRTHKKKQWDNFGRVLAEVYAEIEGDERVYSLAEALKENGHEKVL